MKTNELTEPTLLAAHLQGTQNLLTNANLAKELQSKCTSKQNQVFCKQNDLN